MTSFKKNSLTLVLALGLLGVACGDSDDDKKATDSGTAETDAGSTGGDKDAGGGGGEGAVCVGGYEGFKESQITDNIKDPKGACVSPVDVTGVCTKNPSGQAKDVGVPCYFAFAGNADLTPAEVATMTGDCALNGKGTAKGLKTLLEPMTTGCISCYVDAVVCSAQNCPAECGSGTDEECNACRADKGCTDAFFVCSGLPTGEEIEAAK